MSEELTNGGAKYQRWIRSEVAIAFSFGAVLWGIFTYITSPQVKQQQTDAVMSQNIALIQQSIDNINKNHEAHIQDILTVEKSHSEEILQLQKSLVQVETENQLILQKLTK